MYSFQYVWKPKTPLQEHNLPFLENLFKTTCTLYNDLTPCHWDFKITPLFAGKLYVIQISSDVALKQNLKSPDANFEIFHSGFIESSDPNLSEEVLKVYNHPNRLQNLPGKYFLAIANLSEKKLLVANSCDEGPSLWKAEGPNGMAVGYRPGIVADLCGIPRELDTATAKIFCGNHYNSSLRSLFKNVSRFTTRDYDFLTPDSTSWNTKKYVKLSERISQSFDWTLDDVAQNLVNRLNFQLKTSPDPRLFLTGGYDSRLIAAAAHKAGFQGPTYTFGPEKSGDRIVAQKISKALGWENFTNPNQSNLIEVGNQNFEQVLKWTKANESLETLRHSLSFTEILRSKPETMDLLNTQIFHGIQITRCRLYNTFHKGLQKKSKAEAYRRMVNVMGPFHDAETKPYSTEYFENLWDDVADLNPTVTQFLDAFCWQSRSLFWFDDGSNVKMLFSHRWSPLVNPCQLSQIWNMSVKDKRASKNHIDLTLHLCPELKDIPYGSQDSLKKDFQKWVLEKIKPLPFYHNLRNFKHRKQSRNNAAMISTFSNLDDFWDKVFSDVNTNSILSDEKRNAIQAKDKNSEVLWSLGSMAVFKKACV